MRSSRSASFARPRREAAARRGRAVLAAAGRASADTFGVVEPVVPPRAARRSRAPRCRTSTARCSCRRGVFEAPFGVPQRARLRGAAGALAARRRRLRDSVAGARRDQQDRDELRPQHGPELGRRRRLDAVHARHLAPLGHRRVGRRHRRSVEPGRRGLRGRPLPRRRRRRRGPRARGLRLQPRRLVRRRRARARGDLRRREHRRRRRLHARPARARARGGADSRRRAQRGAPRGREPRATRRRAPPQAAFARAEAQELLSDELVARAGGVPGRPRARGCDERGRAPAWRAGRRRGRARARAGGARTRRRSRRRPRASSPRRPAPTATSSRSAAARAPSPSRTTTTTIPAADIAAPQGAPVYALADAMVVRLVDDARCGTGADAPDARRPDVGVLPPLLPRQRARAGDAARGRPVGRARRLDRPLDRARTSTSA